MKISIIGLGKLGSPFAAWIASKGHDVEGVDVNPDIRAALSIGEPPVDEPGLGELLNHIRFDEGSGHLHVTDEVQSAVLDTEITFIVVPTPTIKEENPKFPSEVGGAFSLRYVKDVAMQIALALKAKTEYHLVVIVSTVMPGHTQEILEHIEKISGKKCGKDFGVAYNPEFIALGSVLNDLQCPDFVLIGQSDNTAGNVLHRFYEEMYPRPSLTHSGAWDMISEELIGVPIRRMKFVNAEIAKLALNCFVTMKISYANMLARLCEAMPGADVDQVTGAIGLDSRIGSKYLKGATPFCGPCFPRDNLAFTQMRFPKAPAVMWGLPLETRRENQYMLMHIIDKVVEYTRPGDTVGIIGTAYKVGTSVTEESTGTALVRFLEADKLRSVMTWDPCAECTNSLRELLTVADVLVVTLPFEELAELPELAFTDICIIDCWRCIPEDELGPGCTYVPIGRHCE